MDNLHPLESKVLLALTRQPDAPPTLDQLAASTGLEPSQLSMAVEWLLAKSLIAVQAETVAHIASLTPIGELFFEKYAPIERVLSAAREAGQTGKRLTIQDIQAKEALEPSDVSKAVGTLKKEGAILIVQGGCIESTGRNSATAEAMRSLLQELRSGQRELQSFPEPLRSVLQQHAVKRGNAREPFRIDERVTRSFVLTPAGQEVAEQLSRDGVAEEVSQLTPELLKEGAWRTKRFRKYTISLRAPRIAAGKRHPYREFLDLVKLKLVSMGFQEMRGTLVETEFWNMDALFMPQFHPARDIHDVYFVKNPTHATDFFQVEGIVLGADINFRTLLGLLNLFAREVAQAKEVKFLPAYFPFTEPSVEMHVRHPKLGWMELGGAGLFRPEVTTPLGVSVPVIAWGLGLDRMAMVALGIHDIRDLFSADLEFIRTMRGSF